jgi:hypothetical protein
MNEILSNFLERLGFVESRSATAMRLAGQKRNAEHRAGWMVYMGGKLIAKLDFIEQEWPWYVFRFTFLGDDHGYKQLFIKPAHRDPDPNLIFKNQADQSVIVADGQFLASLMPDDVLWLRDYRPFQPGDTLG